MYHKFVFEQLLKNDKFPLSFLQVGSEFQMHADHTASFLYIMEITFLFEYTVHVFLLKYHLPPSETKNPYLRVFVRTVSTSRAIATSDRALGGVL